MAPSQDSSDHQDCYVFRGSQPKRSFTTGILGGGKTPRYEVGEMIGWWSFWEETSNLPRFFCVLVGLISLISLKGKGTDIENVWYWNILIYTYILI